VLSLHPQPAGKLPRRHPEDRGRGERGAGEYRAQGLQSITAGLVDAITGAKSLGKVFSNVAKQILADLLKIQIERNIVGPLANALGAAFGSALGGSGGGEGGVRRHQGRLCRRRLYREHAGTPSPAPSTAVNMCSTPPPPAGWACPPSRR
jgi:hypothetical protein